MVPFIFFLFVLIGQVACSDTHGAEEPFEGINYGTYSVGVRFSHQLDASRTILNGNPRPVQITIWYPALEGQTKTLMTYADYYGYKSSEFDPRKQDRESSVNALQKHEQYVMQAGPVKSEVEKVFSSLGKAALDADPLDGKFPLLIYAPGFNESPSENIVLCEYLASHGYIIAGCPSAGPDTREMQSSISGIRTQAADLAFVLKRMLSEKNVDQKKIGTIGYSWGGLSNVLFATENESVKAIANLDGSICVPAHQDKVKALFELKPGKISIPFFYFASYRIKPKPDPHDYSFLNEAVNSERYLLKLNGLSHGNFSSMYVSAFQYYSTEMKRGIAPKRVFSGYRAVCFYLLKYFDAHLKNDPAAKEVFSQSPANHGFISDLLSINCITP